MRGICFYMILLLTLCKSSWSQKQNDFLLSFSDSSSGELLYGYKTSQGKIVIRAKYMYIQTDTLYSMTMVLRDSIGWIGIDKNDSVLIVPFIFDNGPDYLEEGVFRFVENNKIGFSDPNGNKVIPAQFDFVLPFKDGIAEYTLGGHREYEKGGEHWWWTGGYEDGFINHSGARFKKTTELVKGKREAWTWDDKHVLLDQKGVVIKELKK
jgi:hypothetical protein